MKSKSWRVLAVLTALVFVSAALVFAEPNPNPPRRPIAVDVTDGVGTFSPDPAPIETWVNVTISVSANRPVPAPPITIGAPTWRWSLDDVVEYSPNGSEPWSIYRGDDVSYMISAGPTSSFAGGVDYSQATIKARFPKGGFWRVLYEPHVKYTASRGPAYAGIAKAKGKAIAVEVISLKVISVGPKKINATNWAVVCNGTSANPGNALIQVTLKPDFEAAAAAMTWTGDGAAVAGQPLQRSVDVYQSVKRTVKATVGSGSKEVTVWPIWATVAVTVAGPSPANAKFPQPYNAGGQYGVWYNTKKSVAYGKIGAIATLTPPGVGAVVTTGWDTKRVKMRHNFVNGAQMTGFYGDVWIDDTSFPRTKTTVPDAANKLYDWDAPNCGKFSATDTSVEINFNAQQYVTWYGAECSYKTDASAAWYWQARWKAAATPQIVSAAVAAGNLDLDLYTTPLP